MELPHLGKHCSNSACNKLDFLPIKCDSCKLLYCDEHYKYAAHNCSKSYKKNNQVPVCPLCNIPIPVKKGEHPDYIVGQHIDSDCQSDPAKSHRKVFVNKCAHKGCKTKEIVPVICNDCRLNFCLKHRHTSDHNCIGAVAAARGRRLKKFTWPSPKSMDDEDEELARALELSMQKPCSKKQQEESDLALAKQLQASEMQSTTGPSSSLSDRCTVC